MSKLRTRALVGAALTTSAIVALPATASALSVAPPSPAGGDLNLELTGGAAASLDRQKVTVSATAPAKRAGDVLTTPASTVRFGRDKVLTTNGGSIVFRKGSRRVSFSTLSTHLSNRIRIRASINGETKTVLTATRKKTRVTFDKSGTNSELHATRLRLTTAGAREIREGLKLQRLGRGTLTKAYGKFQLERKGGSVPAPSPIPVPVSTPGNLVWTQINDYPTPAPAGNNGRTWLGYFTNSATGPAAMGTNRGTFTPSDGAEGPTVTPTSQRGPSAVYTTTFPMASSTVNAATKTGIIRYGGLVTYRSEPMPAGHGITVAIKNPRIEFDGSNTAKLYATGLRTAGDQANPGGTEPYDDSQPIFTLDLSGATTVANPDNTTTFRNVPPTIAVTGHAFPSHPDYAAGTGPNRTPNTFGTFDITVPNPPAVGPHAGR